MEDSLREVFSLILRPKPDEDREELFKAQRAETFEANQAFIESDDWTVTERASGGSYVAGLDWEPNFEDGTITYYRYNLSFKNGYLLMHSSSFGSSKARAVRRWYAPLTRTVSCRITAENWGASSIQIQFNGAITGYSGDNNVNFTERQGLNVMVVMTNGTPDNIELRGDFS